MKCNRCGKWAGAYAGFPHDGLCTCPVQHNKVQVTKDMTEKDIMKAWERDWDVGCPTNGYTDAKWRAECEQRSLNLKQKATEEIRKQTYDHLQDYYKALGTNQDSSKAKAKQIGGDHYKNMGIEPWDVVDTWPVEQQIGAHRKDALKYLMRLYDKDTPLDNAAKALHCIEKLIEVLEERDGEL